VPETVGETEIISPGIHAMPYTANPSDTWFKAPFELEMEREGEEARLICLNPVVRDHEHPSHDLISADQFN
jgi:hypothetical protein